MEIAVLGILAGWRRRRTAQCEILTMELIEGSEQHATTKVVVALSDEQLCSLTRDLTRAATARGLVVWPKGVAGRRSLLDRLLDRALGRRDPNMKASGRRPAMLSLPNLSGVGPTLAAFAASNRPRN